MVLVGDKLSGFLVGIHRQLIGSVITRDRSSLLVFPCRDRDIASTPYYGVQ